MNLEEKFMKTLDQCGVKTGARILIGFSGGPDSTALVYLLKGRAAERTFHLFAAYLDHGLRKKTEIDREIKYVRQMTASLGIELFIGRIPQGELNSIALKESRSLEELAREKRYQFFNAVAGKIKADHIALGHNADDQLETMIMRFFQGAGISGLAGIPLCKGRIIRPLYYCTKEEISGYLDKNKQEYSTDSSNASRIFLRNKIRLNLVPVIKNIFPGYMKGLLRLSGQFVLMRDYLKEEAGRRCIWEKKGSGYAIAVNKFCAVPGIIRLYSIYSVLNRLYIDQKAGKKERIPAGFLSPVLDEAKLKEKRVILRGYGIKLIRKDAFLFCIPDIVYPSKKGYLISVNKENIIKVASINRIVYIHDKGKGQPVSGNQVVIKEKGFVPPLVIRSRKNGDTIRLENGTKTLKKLYNEWKVPENTRWMIPVLTDRNQVLGVLGKEFGYTNRLVPGITECGAGSGSGKEPEISIHFAST